MNIVEINYEPIMTKIQLYLLARYAGAKSLQLQVWSERYIESWQRKHLSLKEFMDNDEEIQNHIEESKGVLRIPGGAILSD